MELKYSGKVSDALIDDAQMMLLKYKGDSEYIRNRARENMRIYRAEYACIYDPEKGKTRPKTPYILSAVENKYADYLDNSPAPNFLPRSEDDEQTAKLLGKIIPAQLEMSGFRGAYKKVIRQKLICGTGIYGIFYDRKKEEPVIKSLDLLSVYVDVNVSDVQDSKYLYICGTEDNDRLKEMYPESAELFEGDAALDGYGQSRNRSNQTEIIDCYYKTTDGRVHMLKFAKNEVILATEDIEGYENGVYEHGKFPVVFDVLYPEVDSPYGFGLVDTTKNVQMYIDEIDGAVLKNSLISANSRWLVNRNAGFDLEAFADIEQQFIETNNINDDALRRLDMGELPGSVITHRNQKILELKEIAANRDVSSGGTAQGVTAASAITALQEAGDKQSRAMITDSFDSYTAVVKMLIEVMRQYFDAERVYRITNTQGVNEYRRFSREKLLRAEAQKDALGFTIGTKYRRVDFDIEIVPQKQNAFRRETNNQTILALWGNGFFAPQNLDMSIAVLPFMQFDGKDAIVQKLSEVNENMQANIHNSAMQSSRVPLPEEGDVI